ncbi:MAG: RDD family protein [Pseudohongiellaceae bacterium]
MDTLDYDTLPRARLMRRLAALLYDGFLVAAIWMLIGFALQLVVGPGTNELVDGVVKTDPTLNVITFSLMVASASGFYLWFWRRSGQTLGMMSWRLKLVSTENKPVNLQQGLLRYSLAWPSFFVAGIGYFWLYLDSHGDALHDRLSKTKVIVVPKSHRPFD